MNQIKFGLIKCIIKNWLKIRKDYSKIFMLKFQFNKNVSLKLEKCIEIDYLLNQ